ncbi:DUF6345 domain-containing protein [Nocardioides rubriscoriae]|uniref:DUF6345 domain-containing protein n=1 Tax=Nocardioides rubriscoriae TaxID=642762 RepID=UPI0011E02A02|nr:DUF6345 domain-containing protein [Nocardioides rubriscoriae]
MIVTPHPHRRTRRRRRASVGLAVLAVASTMLALGGPDVAQAAPVPTPPMRGFELSGEAPVYEVLRTGLSPEEAKDLADRAGVSAGALRKDGSFSFVDARRAGLVPTRAGVKARDEHGRTVQARTLDLAALRATKVLDAERALGRAADLLPTPEGFEARPVVSHTRVQVSVPRRRIRADVAVDTAVSYRLNLDGVPVVGPGAKSRITFDGDGRVLSLVDTHRAVQKVDTVGIIGPETAQRECARMYGERVDQGLPRLVYPAPALGDGSVRQLLPAYACQPAGVARDAVSAVSGLLVPASPDRAPQVALGAERADGQVRARIAVDGGTAPYSIAWSSSSTPLATAGDTVSYAVRARRGSSGSETLSVQVTDANGVVSAASVVLAEASSSAEATGFGGGGGSFAEVGIEQTVDEWQCAQDSAIGFKAVMQGRGHSVNFDWRGASAWEQDFHERSTGGHDDQWVDSVDAQWYTGHGSPGSFTFKSSKPDGSIVPSEARWGDDDDLEWMQLESCQVLKDTAGGSFGGWAQSFDRLHLLNGFVTNAQCVGGGTGGRFAEYLFPTFWRPALPVSSAWAQMAQDLEPSGTIYRTVSPIGAGFTTNLSDRFWGQGATTPDIAASQRIGFIWITGTV